MRKLNVLFIVLTVASLFVACKSEKSQSDALSVQFVEETEPTTPTAEKKTPAYLEQRVRDIYTKVFAEYNHVNEVDEVMNMPDPDSLYCSKDWNLCLTKVLEYDSEYNAEEIGFFDFDYWVMGQDFHDLRINDVKTVSLKNNRAEVLISFYNYDTINEVKLDMIFENDDWLIDDFNAMKKEMKDYVKGK